MPPEVTALFDPIEAAIKDIAQGRVVIVVDDSSRENEGDFVCAADKVTPEIVNFMATHGRGLICVSLLGSRCDELGLEMMVTNNTASFGTPFTVSVDLIGEGCTTGISSYDRAKTITALVNPRLDPKVLGRPGHIFPLKAKSEGVLRRPGHTEAAVDLARLAGCYPAGALVEIMNPDGTMARLPNLENVAKKHGLKLVSINDLIRYRLRFDTLIERRSEVSLPTKYGTFRLISYKEKHSGEQHIVLLKGSWADDEAVLVRVHSSCFTGDVLGSCRCDCGEQLQAALQQIEAKGQGVFLYMHQEGRGIGLDNKLKAYMLQEQKGLDTVEANQHLGLKVDARDYGIGAQILRDLNVKKMLLMTNNPKKRAALEGYGLSIVENIPLKITPNKHNSHYLSTKRDKLGHAL